MTDNELRQMAIAGNKQIENAIIELLKDKEKLNSEKEGLLNRSIDYYNTKYKKNGLRKWELWVNEINIKKINLKKMIQIR